MLRNLNRVLRVRMYKRAKYYTVILRGKTRRGHTYYYGPMYVQTYIIWGIKHYWCACRAKGIQNYRVISCFQKQKQHMQNGVSKLICSSISIRELSEPMRVCIKDCVNRWYKMNKSIIWRKIINTQPNWQYDIYYPIKREQMVADGKTWWKQSLLEKGRCLWCD